MHREHSQRFENAIYIAKIMLILKKSVMKISKKPFSLDPNLANLKDNITSHSKQTNWALVSKELKKFGIRIDSEKKAKIIEGRTALICEILAKLFDFDNNGQLQSGRFQDGNVSEINYVADRDGSVDIYQNNDSTNISVIEGLNNMNGKDSTSILLGAPIAKKQELDPLSPQGSSTRAKLPTQLQKNISINGSPKISPQIGSKKVKTVNNSITSLNEINESKEISEAETTLEFILISLAKNLGIKPKQAAGLLSNNHKYLVHIAVKGMKGSDYSKIQDWYKDIYAYAKQIVTLIDHEKEHNAMKLTLNILKVGLFSQNTDLVINCARVLSIIGQEINQIRGQLSGLAWDWFVDNSSVVNNQISLNDIQVPDFAMGGATIGASETLSKQLSDNTITAIPTPINECGLASCVYALKKNSSEVLEYIAPIFAHYGKNNYMEMFTHHLLTKFSDSKALYFSFIHDLVIVMNGSQLFNEAIFNSGVMDEWVNMGIRMADYDGTNTVQERIAALAFLVDMWEIRSDKIEDNNDIAQAILTVLKRGCRDRSRILRILCFEKMFKLLHTFSTGRNQFAPIIYKSLTFLLIEFHSDTEIREQMMRQFQLLFQQVQTIPVGILLEPLLKQIEISAGGTYDFNIFDFEFLNVIVHHKRCNVAIGLQVLETMVNVATNTIFYANSAISIILEVIHRFAKDSSLHQQFSITTKQQLQNFEDIEKQKVRSEQDLKKAQEFRNKQLSDSIAKNALNRFVTKKLTEETKAKTEEERQAFEAASLARKTRERLIVNLFKQVIMFGNEMIKQDIRTSLLKTYTKIEREAKVKSKGINYLLMLYGEDIPQMLQYFVEEEKKQSFKNVGLDQLQYGTPNSIDLINMQLDQLNEQSQNQLVPYNDMQNETQKKLSKAQAHLEKVLKDIEKIKSIKMERTDKKNLEEELKKVRDDQLKANAKKKVEERQYEHGVVPKTVRNYSLDVHKEKTARQENSIQIRIIKPKDILEISDLNSLQQDHDNQRLILPSESEQSKIIKNPLLKTLKEFQLYDLRYEEQKDQDAVRFFVKKNLKIFRNLFGRYSNTMGVASNVNNTFDNIQSKNTLITVAEVSKMLKEFGISQLQVSQKDLMQMFRLINKDIFKKKDKSQASLTVLEFEGFVELMLQIAVHIYHYENEMTPAEYLQRLFDHLRAAAQRNRSNLAKLFDDQTQSGVVDNDLIKELNRRLARDPHYQLPDGFTKVVEKEIVNAYKIPEYFPIEKCQRVSIEILDDLINNLFGFHFIEPMSEILEVSRAKPVLKMMARDKVISEINAQKNVQNTIIQAKKQRSRGGIDRVSVSIDVNPIKNQRSLIKNNNNTSATNSRIFKSPRPSVISKPPLGVELKLQVAKTPAPNRAMVLETAYVLEEMLYSVENGLSTLPPPNYHLNPLKPKIINRVIEGKHKKMEDDERQRREDKIKLELRKKMLREQLEKMKEEKDKERLVNEQKKKLDDSKVEARKKRIVEKQNEQMQKLKEEFKQKADQKQKEEEEKKKKEKVEDIQDTERKKKEAQEQLKKRKKLLMEALKKKTEDRKASIKRDEEEKTEKEKLDKLKSQQIKKMYAETKSKQQELKERYKQEYQAFAESQEVQNVFMLYEKSLMPFFDLVSKYDNYEGGKLSYNAYVKFGHNYQLTPTIIPTQDFIYIYKTIMREKAKQFDASVNYNSILDVQGTKLTYQDFREALLKIACLSKLKLGGLSSSSNDKEGNEDNSGKRNSDKIIEKKDFNKRSHSVKPNESVTFEKEFDTTDMTETTLENLFKYLHLKIDRTLLNQTLNNQSPNMDGNNDDNSQDRSAYLNNDD